ncbi:hypothetical protein VNO77_37449 [Canavalia gladiata]|uniref:Uncharacterized protein n=1 Tax=Canavalia gladiata TaxID=3824 RepID=A0AAN9KAA9_CANGL
MSGPLQTNVRLRLHHRHNAKWASPCSVRVAFLVPSFRANSDVEQSLMTRTLVSHEQAGITWSSPRASSKIVSALVASYVPHMCRTRAQATLVFDVIQNLDGCLRGHYSPGLILGQQYFKLSLGYLGSLISGSMLSDSYGAAPEQILISLT